MNVPKARNIQWKGISRRLRTTAISRIGIHRYDKVITASEITWSQRTSESQRRQNPCGMKSVESRLCKYFNIRLAFLGNKMLELQLSGSYRFRKGLAASSLVHPTLL